MNIDHMGPHVYRLKLEFTNLALLHHDFKLFLIRVDPKHMLFERVWHDFLVADLALNFTFFLALFRCMMASIVPFH